VYSPGGTGLPRAPRPAHSARSSSVSPGASVRSCRIDARQVTVREREFGRTLVFLDPPRHALVSRQADVARDARAVMGVLRAQNATRAWHARWREPVSLDRADGYGVERSYHLASDSSRAIQLERSTSARGAFGGDTTTAAGAPAWRHAGVDVAAAKGTRVLSPAAGTVADVGDYVLTGRTVLVDHGIGVFSAYFHLDTVLVRRGDEVTQGKILGRVGSTGLSTGPHLHYGIYVHGKDVDPASWHAMPRWAYDSVNVATLRRASAAARPADSSAATKSGGAGGR
jgi:murein DD-endopeptidase MepM/ murein hydrolase activator NlpD